MGEDMIQTGFRVDREKKKKFDDLCEKNGLKYVWVLNRLMDYFIENEDLPQNKESNND